MADNYLRKIKDDKLSKKVNEFMNWLKRQHKDKDAFVLAAQSYKRLLSIVPFYVAIGRTLRAFVDAILLLKEQRMTDYPPNFAKVRSMDTNELAELIKKHCKPI